MGRKQKTGRAFAFIATGYMPDEVPEGHEPSFVMPQMHASFAMQELIGLVCCVAAAGETPESLMARLTQQAESRIVSPHGKPQ